MSLRLSTKAMSTKATATSVPPVPPVAVDVAVDRCTGCLECAAVCANGALTQIPGLWAVRADTRWCGGCRRCVGACPSHAITVIGPVRTRHRVVLDDVHAALAQACPSGWRVAVAEPLPGWTHVPTPDIAVLPPLPGSPLERPPVALVIEVISPTSRARDLGPRRDRYWEAGVPAYWTVEQGSGEITVHWSLRPSWFDLLSRRPPR